MYSSFYEGMRKATFVNMRNGVKMVQAARRTKNACQQPYYEEYF